MVLSTAAAAQKHYGPRVTDTEIKIGQTMPIKRCAGEMKVKLARPWIDLSTCHRIT